MSESFEELVTEMNYISAALDFISESIECHESEGKEVNKSGLAYLTRLLGGRSSCAAETCWGLKLTSGSGVTDGGES